MLVPGMNSRKLNLVISWESGMIMMRSRKNEKWVWSKVKIKVVEPLEEE